MVQNALVHLNQKKSIPTRAGKVVNIKAKHANSRVNITDIPRIQSRILCYFFSGAIGANNFNKCKMEKPRGGLIDRSSVLVDR